MAFKLRTNPSVKAAAAYKIPTSSYEIKLKIDANEGSCSPVLVNKYLTQFPADKLSRYPDKANLEAKIAERNGISASQVIVTAGGDDAIDRTIRSFLWEGRELILPVPSFEMFEKYANNVGAIINKLDWATSFPVDEVIAAVTPDTGVIALVTPNNPTGAVIDIRDIKRISEAAPECLLIVDNAYIEFADVDITQEVLQLKNAVIIRTFSKSWGMAGLRLGYAMGSEEIISYLRAAGGPYPVSSLSIYIGEKRLAEDSDEVAAYIEEIKREREDLYTYLSALGCEISKTQSNFVFLRIAQAEAIKEQLEKRGILIRFFKNNPALSNAIRITLPGNKADYAFLKYSVQDVLKELDS